jgi:hypothetical protein
MMGLIAIPVAISGLVSESVLQVAPWLYAGVGLREDNLEVHRGS